MLAIIVQPDGSVEEKDFTAETSYATFSEGVKGYIEGHQYAEGLEHYHNEEFLYAEGEVFGSLNLTAYVLSGGGLFFGPVVFHGGADDEGEALGLSLLAAEVVRSQAQIVRDNLEALQALTAGIGKPEPYVTITTW